MENDLTPKSKYRKEYKPCPKCGGMITTIFIKYVCNPFECGYFDNNNQERDDSPFCMDCPALNPETEVSESCSYCYEECADDYELKNVV